MAGRFVVRAATHADYNDIININRNVNDGLDYLHALYHQFLQDPDVHPYVGLLDGRVICFKIHYTFRGEPSAVGVAGRTHPQFQSKGYQRCLDTESKKQLREKFPKLENYVWAQLYRTQHEVIRQRPHIVHYSRLRNTYFNVSQEQLVRARELDIPHNVNMGDFMKVEQLSTEGALSLLTDESYWPIFFHLPYFEAFSHWLPMPVTKYYLRLTALRNRVLATPDHISGRYKSVSLGDILPVPRGYRYNFYYYGDNEADLTAHALRHVHYLADVLPPGANLFISMKYYEHVGDADFRKIMAPVLGPVFISDVIKSDFVSTFKAKL